MSIDEYAMKAAAERDYERGMKSEAVADTSEASIDTGLAYLDDRIDRLAHVLDRLESRVAVILIAGEPSVDPSATLNRPGRSPIAGAIYGSGDRIDRIAGRLVDLTARLDLA